MLACKENTAARQRDTVAAARARALEEKCLSKIDDMLCLDSVVLDMGKNHGWLGFFWEYLTVDIVIPYLRMVEMGEQMNTITNGNFTYKVNTPEYYNTVRKTYADLLLQTLVPTLDQIFRMHYEKGTLVEELRALNPTMPQATVNGVALRAATVTIVPGNVIKRTSGRVWRRALNRMWDE